jgi:ribosome maturation protein Sdo1
MNLGEIDLDETFTLEEQLAFAMEFLEQQGERAYTEEDLENFFKQKVVEKITNQLIAEGKIHKFQIDDETYFYVDEHVEQLKEEIAEVK